ncbi:NUDIX hydrolase [Arthrobacter sp. zg-Y1219]|uniref:NUDIX hydrolase n=1 Tax=Arthrobacter sp. zg-Y1219 TaxID=3049067 RepID=UPI0024C3D10C|nr:NUDIX hydrolase [Arthrobacter sp. zg-Y1219]MDK1359286.1 NUDIX hydrolase [Arthrobacter sp. zg-Y1219]
MAAQGLSGFYGSVFKRSTTAAVLIRSTDGRVLLLRSGSGSWDLPGGVVLGAEDPRSASRRIVAGTLGLELGVGRVLVLDYIQAGASPGAARPGSQGDSIAFVYDGGELATSVAGFTAGGGEREARFVPVPDCAAVLGEAVARRVAGALEALDLGTVTELVDGSSTPGEPAVPPPTRRMMPPVGGFSGILGR